MKSDTDQKSDLSSRVLFVFQKQKKKNYCKMNEMFVDRSTEFYIRIERQYKAHIISILKHK